MSMGRQPVIVLSLALMAGGPGGDQAEGRSEGAVTQGLAHMFVLYE
ncbi:hypothetical protein MNZ22_06970 [Aeromonas encheleia]|nr:hypothetical protein [Aeromonas encheleia]UNP90009.1 hypothetical protein MNZ22_06970 [Aeromonas encheleia]